MKKTIEERSARRGAVVRWSMVLMLAMLVAINVGHFAVGASIEESGWTLLVRALFYVAVACIVWDWTKLRFGRREWRGW